MGAPSSPTSIPPICSYTPCLTPPPPDTHLQLLRHKLRPQGFTSPTADAKEWHLVIRARRTRVLHGLQCKKQVKFRRNTRFYCLQVGEQGSSPAPGGPGHRKSSPQPEPCVDEAGGDQHGVDEGLLLLPGVALLFQHAQPPRDPRQLQGKQRGRQQPCRTAQEAGAGTATEGRRNGGLPPPSGPPAWQN